MKRKFGLVLSLVLLLTMVLVACAQPAATSQVTESSGTASTQTTGQTSGSSRDDIVIALGQEPATLDPNNMGDGAGFFVSSNLYDSLVWITDDYQVKPQLAKEWTISDDGLEYTFTLRDDVTFQNGEHFTSADVKYTYDRAMQSAYAGAVTSNIDSVSVLGDYQIKIKLKAPYAPAMECFGSSFLRIVNKKAVEAAGDKFAYNPVGAGTGPYKFVSWTSGQNIILEANENYFGGAPAIKNVEVRFMSDSSATTIAIETGEVDLGMIGVLDVPKYEEDPNLSVSTTPSVVYNYFGFNTQAKPFDNPLVRQAVAYSCDKNELLTVSWEGTAGGTVTATPVSQSGFGFNSKLSAYPKDIEKAKSLLTQAGYPNGFKSTIYVGEQSFRKNIATYMQSCLAEIGITVNIEVMQQAALLEQIKKGGADMFVMGFSGISGDADFYLYNNYHSGTSYNYTKYSNSALDAKLEAARKETDKTKRNEMYQEISQIIYSDVPDMPNYFLNWIYGFNSKLNYTASPFLRLYVKDMSWK